MTARQWVIGQYLRTVSAIRSPASSPRRTSARQHRAVRSPAGAACLFLGTGRETSAGLGYPQGCLIVTGLDRRRVPSLMALAHQWRGDQEVRGGPVAGNWDIADNRDPD